MEAIIVAQVMMMPLSPPPPTLLAHKRPRIVNFSSGNYTLATELNKKSEAVQVTTLLTVISEEAREVFLTFDWTAVGDEEKIEPSFQLTVNHRKVSPLNATVSIVMPRNLVRLTKSTGRPCTKST